MQQILVLNAGSSSLKYELFAAKNLKSLKRGMIDRLRSHEKAIAKVLSELDPKKISLVAHRVVHGGTKYSQPVRINMLVMRNLKKLVPLAPLHNPANIAGIKACQKLLKRVPQVAVFDTAFHQTMPEKAYRYALPEKFLQKDQIRRYGFHGSSHKYVVNEAIKLMRNRKARIISCHLGNGCSITASKSGKCIDTSMGFTPLEGIAMGTRSGSIDPAIVLHLAKKLKIERIDKILNSESGLKAISGYRDMRDIYAKSEKGHKKSLLALEIFAYQIAKMCGAYGAALKGLDALVFTGGIGENAHYVRAAVCRYLTHLGLSITPAKNRKNARAIHAPSSKVKTYVIPTHEEKQIAIDGLTAIKN